MPNYWLLPGIFLFCINAQAAEQKEQELPSEELLEFLADWEDSSGKWVGPEEVEKLPDVDTDKTREHRDAK